MVNRTTLLGYVGGEPTFKINQSGKEYASFSLATNEAWIDKASGEKKEKTEWHKIVVYTPHLISLVKKYIKKGTNLYLEGQLSYHDKVLTDGTRHTSAFVTLNLKGCIRILGSSKEKVEEVVAQPNNTAKSTPSQLLPVEEFIDDEIPF